MKKIGIIGAGSWGTALGVTLGGKGFQVRMWDIDPEHRKALARDRENKAFLPGISLPETLTAAETVEEALEGADIALFSAPAQHFRSALSGALPYLKQETAVVNVAKGIEQKTLKTMSQVAEEVAPGLRYAVLSGPSHAEEVGRGLPTTVVAASPDEALAEEVQEAFITERFRVYAHHDVKGVELGGSLKNIIALGAGISDGMGFGDNAKAAMMTRGIAEMSRLGIRLGAEAATFSGLTGIGDLIVTCTSMHSRNRRCGILIGQGEKPGEAVRRIGMVVEGMFTAEAAYQLAREAGVEMPITESIYEVIQGTLDPRQAVTELMTRGKKHEGK